MELRADYPCSAPICTTNLPQTLTLQWNSLHSNLADVIRQFEEALRSYQALWRVLEDIDRNTWVLEPERPTLTSSMRRIALGTISSKAKECGSLIAASGNHCSVQVVLDTSAPTAVPQCRFLGNESRVASLREKLNANLHLWYASNFHGGTMLDN